MKLYLVRHGAAGEVAASDAERVLTETGRQEARRVGRALAVWGPDTGRVLTSPLVRARQTAELIVGEFKTAVPVTVLNELGNGHSTTVLLRALRTWAGLGGLVLVGHMPSLAEHLAELVGAGARANFHFRTGTVACVHLTEWRVGAGELGWLAGPEQLAAGSSFTLA